MKKFSIGDTFVVNGAEWKSRRFVFYPLFEGWCVEAENIREAQNGRTQIVSFSLTEIEIALGLTEGDLA